MSEVVRISTTGDIAVATIDRPPVNAIDQALRAGLLQAFAVLRQRCGIKAIVLAATGKTFMAGADFKEFDAGFAKPGCHEVFRLIEDSPVPVIAAIHGTALGGGTELALACHYRVAGAGASFGLPELALGVIPGAGGTQRLPRLIPLAAALDMMLSGRLLCAERALELGLVDALVVGDPTAGAIDFALDLVARGNGPRRTREQPVRGAENAIELLLATRAVVAKTMPNRESPNALLDALHAAVELPFDDGLQVEIAKWEALPQATEARALRHLFRAERMGSKISGRSASDSGHGPVGIRMMDAYGREVARCLREGAPPALVDGALATFGMATDALPAHGLAARVWQNDERPKLPRRKPDADEIVERCLYAMINEGALLLQEGVALRASDIDTICAAGCGFPRYRGGPMFYADTLGLKKIHERILEFQRATDSPHWAPAPLLERLALADSSFAQWQTGQARGDAVGM